MCIIKPINHIMEALINETQTFTLNADTDGDVICWTGLARLWEFFGQLGLQFIAQYIIEFIEHITKHEHAAHITKHPARNPKHTAHDDHSAHAHELRHERKRLTDGGHDVRDTFGSCGHR